MIVNIIFEGSSIDYTKLPTQYQNAQVTHYEISLVS